MDRRIASVQRTTDETEISVELDLDGDDAVECVTGIGFLNHLLETLALHGSFQLELICGGDLHIDDHHTAEDCAIALGRAFDEALGDRRGINRFGHGYAPLDEALARAVIDFSGRPHAEVNLGLEGYRLGELATENVSHVIRSFAMNANATVHVDVLRGANDHHRAEAAFKALALAIRQAVVLTDRETVASTKGTLE